MIAPTTFHDGRVTLHHGDSRDVLKTLADASIDSVVCDPPYALVSIGKRFGAEGAAPAQFGRDGAYQRASAGFMGKRWDTGETAFAVEFWSEVLRVLKPGGNVVAFGGTRTYHRLACAIEDAGFEIRDQLAWVYGSGFPKSHDVSKGIDRADGAEREVVGVRQDFAAKANKVHGDGQWRDGQGFKNPNEIGLVTAPATDAARQWSGWGTALKPSIEPIVLARKPLIGTVAANVLAHGTGAISVDACRVDAIDNTTKAWRGAGDRSREEYRTGTSGKPVPTALGRWPANLLHDGSDEVVGCFPQSGNNARADKGRGLGYGSGSDGERGAAGHNDTGSAARFFPAFPLTEADRIFYSAKADSGVLNDTDPKQRVLGIDAGLAWGTKADATVVYDDFGVTPGMRLGIDRAEAADRSVEWRRLFRSVL